MARLYTNENFPRQVVLSLRQLGHDVLTALEAGNANQGISDEAVLAFATEQNRAVIIINRRDFVRLYHATPLHSGIIICSQDADTTAQASRIDQAISDLNTLTGQLIRVNRPSN